MAGSKPVLRAKQEEMKTFMLVSVSLKLRTEQIFVSISQMMKKRDWMTLLKFAMKQHSVFFFSFFRRA